MWVEGVNKMMFMTKKSFAAMYTKIICYFKNWPRFIRWLQVPVL